MTYDLSRGGLDLSVDRADQLSGLLVGLASVGERSESLSTHGSCQAQDRIEGFLSGGSYELATLLARVICECLRRKYKKAVRLLFISFSPTRSGCLCSDGGLTRIDVGERGGSVLSAPSGLSMSPMKHPPDG